MEWSALLEAMKSSIPEDILNDPLRLKDYLQGARAAYKRILLLFEDDRK